MTTDRNDPRLKELLSNGQQATHLVLPEEERAKGFVRPVRKTYVHLDCGKETTMSQGIAETYARDPEFYGSTWCSHCLGYFKLRKVFPGSDELRAAFRWAPDLNEGVGE